ncbi:hypothetical protein DFJ74DRAFT_306851 [Hyaloraphidium curvatum]|nr:hypothetical protein DFJ74DRAFT_306851 [Hyaloraphidium curvatum]
MCRFWTNRGSCKFGGGCKWRHDAAGYLNPGLPRAAATPPRGRPLSPSPSPRGRSYSPSPPRRSAPRSPDRGRRSRSPPTNRYRDDRNRPRSSSPETRMLDRERQRRMMDMFEMAVGTLANIAQGKARSRPPDRGRDATSRPEITYIVKGQEPAGKRGRRGKPRPFAWERRALRSKAENGDHI